MNNDENAYFTFKGYQLNNDSNLTSSMEDYLEMIIRLKEKQPFVRINELANNLNVRPSSASKMVTKLSQEGFLEYQKYGIITLTELGKHKIVETVLRDGHQSLAATRMRITDMVPVLEELDDMGYYALEAWGGATFDACLRFLDEDPWDDEFNTRHLGLQWQWHANKKDTYGFTTDLGFIRLYAGSLSKEFVNFWEVPNLLMQKFPAEEFTAMHP